MDLTNILSAGTGRSAGGTGVKLGRIAVTVKPLSELPTALLYGGAVYLGARAMTQGASATTVRGSLYTTVNAMLAGAVRTFNLGLDPEAFTLLSGFTIARAQIAEPLVDWLLGDGDEQGILSEARAGSAAIGLAAVTVGLYMIDVNVQEVA